MLAAGIVDGVLLLASRLLFFVCFLKLLPMVVSVLCGVFLVVLPFQSHAVGMRGEKGCWFCLFVFVLNSVCSVCFL